MLAAEAAAEAFAQGKFWDYHDLLFDNQKALAREDLELYAQQLGLDMDAFRKALDTHKHRARIRADMKEGDRAGVRGTPTIFINGRLYQGNRSVDGYKMAIDKYILHKK